MAKNFANVAERHAELISISDHVATVEIAAAAGGALASYRWRQNGSVVDWLRPADAAAISRRDAGAMACFPLVPYSNRVRGGRFAFADRTIELPTGPDDPHHEHGHGWRRPWTVVWHEAGAVVLRYLHAADSWPWSYEAEQAISLLDGRLCMTISLRNLSEAPMPAGFGLHPYFPSTPWTHLQAPVSGMWETDTEPIRPRASTFRKPTSTRSSPDGRAAPGSPGRSTSDGWISRPRRRSISLYSTRHRANRSSAPSRSATSPMPSTACVMVAPTPAASCWRPARHNPQAFASRLHRQFDRNVDPQKRDRVRTDNAGPDPRSSPSADR
jgi:galactose mutarotase-like enzyme